MFCKVHTYLFTRKISHKSKFIIEISQNNYILCCKYCSDLRRKPYEMV